MLMPNSQVLLILVFASWSAYSQIVVQTTIPLVDNLNPISTTKSLTLPTVAQAQYYIYFAAATCASGTPELDSWTCDFCLQTGPYVSLYAQISDLVYGTYGLVNLKNDTQEIVVSFRPSFQLINWVLDGALVQVPFSGAPSNAKVHTGFLLSTQSLYSQLIPILQTLLQANSSYKLVFTGHSLGAAMASLMLLLVRDTSGFGSVPLALYASGTPRVGNLAFANWVNSLNFQAIRVVNHGDVIAHVMPTNALLSLLGQAYYHFGTELWINGPSNNVTNKFCSNTLVEDPTCANSVGLLGYNALDHFTYWNVNFLSAIFQNPCASAWNLATGLGFPILTCPL